MLDREGGVDDQRLARRGVSDQIGSAAEILVDELLKEHFASDRTNGHRSSSLEAKGTADGRASA